MCYCDDAPQAECYSCRTAKARKRYRCCECFSDILPGELHEVASGKWEGDFSTNRTCSLCVAVREALRLDCWSFGGLADDVSQCDQRDALEVVEFRQRLDVNQQRLRAAKGMT